MSDTPPITDRQSLCDVIPGVSYSILLGNARNIETFEDAFDLLFDKDMFSLIETKANEKIQKIILGLTKHKNICLKSQSTRG